MPPKHVMQINARRLYYRGLSIPYSNKSCQFPLGGVLSKLLPLFLRWGDDNRSGYFLVCRGSLSSLSFEQPVNRSKHSPEKSVYQYKRLSDEDGHSLEPDIWEDTDEHTPWQRHERDHDGDCPLSSVEATLLDLKHAATNEHDSDLETDHQEVDEDEELVAVDTLENVEFVIKSPVVEFVEDLHPNKGVENDCIKLQHLILAISVIVEDLWAGEVKSECDDKLENGLSDNHLPHLETAVSYICRNQQEVWAYIDRDKRCILSLRRSVKDLVGRRIRCQCERGKCVHDEVDPKQLNSFQHRLHMRVIHGSNERQKDGSDINGDLELHHEHLATWQCVQI